jgi:Fe-S cluster assembly scaffold IscU
MTTLLKSTMRMKIITSSSSSSSAASILSRFSTQISHSRALTTSTTLSSSSLPSISGIQKRFYHERVIDHYENPRNVGSLKATDPNVGTGLVGAPACGDVMKLQLQIDPETKVITSAKFKTFGCGSAIASSSLATTLAEGKTVDEVVQIKNSDIARHLSLPPVKLHCSMLAEDAIKAAVADWKKKQETISSSSTSAAQQQSI